MAAEPSTATLPWPGCAQTAPALGSLHAEPDIAAVHLVTWKPVLPVKNGLGSLQPYSASTDMAISGRLDGLPTFLQPLQQPRSLVMVGTDDKSKFCT